MNEMEGPKVNKKGMKDSKMQNDNTTVKLKTITIIVETLSTAITN